MVRVSGDWGRVCFSVSCGFDSGRLFLAPRLNRLGEWKLVESILTSVSEWVVSKPW